MGKVSNPVCSVCLLLLFFVMFTHVQKQLRMKGYILAFSFKFQFSLIKVRMQIQVATKTGTVEEYGYEITLWSVSCSASFLMHLRITFLGMVPSFLSHPLPQILLDFLIKSLVNIVFHDLDHKTMISRKVLN